MKCFSNKIIAILGIIFLGFPSGVFSSQPQVKTEAVFTNNQPVIKVVTVTAPKASVKVLSAKVQQAAGCASLFGTNNLLFPGSFDLNLNQPASCFTFVEPKVNFPVKSLAISEIGAQPKISVVYRQSFYKNLALSKPFPNKTDGVEVSFVLGLLVTIFAFTKSVQYKKTEKLKAVFYQLTVFELLVLRC